MNLRDKLRAVGGTSGTRPDRPVREAGDCRHFTVFRPPEEFPGAWELTRETVAMMSIFASRTYQLRDIVLTGNLTTLPQAKESFQKLSDMFQVRFTIPKYAQYATVIGAALSYFADFEQLH